MKKYILTEQQIKAIAEVFEYFSVGHDLSSLKPIEPLSDGQIMKTWVSSVDHVNDDDDWILGFASAIEAAHGIGK